MKKVFTIFLTVIFFAGCGKVNASVSAASSRESLSEYSTKYEDQFGLYTEEAAADVAKIVPIKEMDNEIFSLFYDKYFVKPGPLTGIANPTSWENSNWIKTFENNHFQNEALYQYYLGLELTILERLDLSFEDQFTDKSFYRARVEKAISCDLKKGDEIIISQQGNENYIIATAPVVINYYLFTPNQRITALFNDPEKAVTTDGESVEIYHTFFSFVLYNETIDGVDYDLIK